MKLQFSKSSGQQGNVLLLAMIISAIMGMTLASYLLMTNNQNVSVMRSQHWNSSIVMSEAGIEDGLQLVNKYGGKFEELTNWPAAITADHWVAVAANVFYTRRFLGENYYDVWVTNNAYLNPSISSVGHFAWHQPWASAPTTMFAAVGVDGETTVSRVDLARKVDVKTKVDPIFNVAMAAKQTIDFNGKNVFTDSFNSAKPLNSAWDTSLGYGLYPMGQLSKTLDNGDVVSCGTIINSLNVGNAIIKGQVKTGPKGTIAIGPNGSVGDKTWVESGKIGIQPEPPHSADDMNVVFPDAVLPTTTWLPMAPNNLSIDGTKYEYAFLTSGDFVIPTISSSVYVGTNAHVRLLITGDVKMTGSSDVIRIAPIGASLKIYMRGTTFSMSGQGVVNESGNANNFYYFGLPSNLYLNFGGNGSFVGAIYAPQADFTLGGGGSNTYDLIGASVTKSVKMNGHFNFHYDENLRDNGMGRGFIPTNWKES